MINHARTVLLNMSQAQLYAEGFEYGQPWPVDPLFIPVKVPSSLLGVYELLIPKSASLDERIRRVDEIISVVEAVDMRHFLDDLDPRTTKSARSASTVRDLYDGMPFSVGGEEVAVLDGYSRSPELFSNLANGSAKLDANLVTLREMAHSSFEGTIRFSAVVIALIYKLNDLLPVG